MYVSYRSCRGLVLAALMCSCALAADTATAPEVYVCPMRGKPCPEVDYPSPGKCPGCGMSLVTRAKYEAQMKSMNANVLRVGVLIYPGFEALDVYGPIEMWSMSEEFDIVTVAESAGLVTSIQGVKTDAKYSFENCPDVDVLMVPGGMGTLKELKNERLLQFIRDKSKTTKITASVCTGSALLAKAGVLDGHKATSNKKYFDIARMQSDKVEWVPSARWVDDGKFVTSSGVSAGMDMALHVIERLLGESKATRAATLAEYRWNKDPNDDPFAMHNH